MHSTVRTSRWSASSSNGGRVCGVIAVLDPPRPQRQRVAHHDPAGRHLPGGDQRVRARLVLTRRGHVRGERREPEMTRLPVQQRAEHARGVEARDAQPADAAVRRDERSRVAVREERVVGDRGERRRRRGALRPFGSHRWRRSSRGCSRRSAVARHHPIRTMAGDASGECDPAPCGLRHVAAFDGCDAVTLAAGRARGDLRAGARDGRRLAAPRRGGARRSPGGVERVRRPRRGHGHPVPASVGEPAGRVLVLAARARRAAAAGTAARPLRRARAADPRPARRQPLLGGGRRGVRRRQRAAARRAGLRRASRAHGGVPVPARGAARGGAHRRSA